MSNWVEAISNSNTNAILREMKQLIDEGRTDSTGQGKLSWKDSASIKKIYNSTMFKQRADDIPDVPTTPTEIEQRLGHFADMISQFRRNNRDVPPLDTITSGLQSILLKAKSGLSV